MTKKVQTQTAERYRVVTTYDYDELPTIASAPMTRAHAMAVFAGLLMSGNYSPHGVRRTRVLSVAECERQGIW